MVSNLDFSGFLFPVFAIRDRNGRICNFDNPADAIKYRNCFSEAERESLSLEVFEYGF